MKYIGLLDCNNFFVSCERLFRPDLVGKPVVVLSGNDGCVVARSNEVKELGVPMGIPYFKVREELVRAGAVAFSSNFPLYRDISSRVISTLRETVGMVEQYSVDEAFFSITIENQTEALERLRHIKSVIEREVGVPVSVGLAKSKTIAKYAAEKEKRGSGVCFLTGSVWQKETVQIPLHDIWGIGAKTSQKMRVHSLETVADLLAADQGRVAKLFGIEGVRKRQELNEESVYLLGDKTNGNHSLMSTRSFGKPVTDRATLEDALAYHVSHLAEELREKRVLAGAVTVILGTSRHSDWMLRGGSQDCILSVPTNDTRILLGTAKKLLKDVYEESVPYKKTGFIVSFLRPEDQQQLDLFNQEIAQDSSQSVLEIMDVLNKKYGDGLVTLGRMGKISEWQPSRKLLSPHYTTKWSDIPSVRAE